MAICLLCMLSWAFMAGAELRFASYFADHMVLQKGPACAVLWGYGESSANVTVMVYQSDNIVMKKMVQAEVFRIWKVVLTAMPQGGPYSIVVRQFYEDEVSSIMLRDVYFGDVWLCSGQSNMEMTVSQIFNASKELAQASHFPYVRVFTASLAQSEEELLDLPDIDLQWSVPTAENLGHGDFGYFSAVCWLFGRYLYETLQYPIGLVESSWGGTPVEAWSSRRALRKCGLSEDHRSFPVSLDSGPKEYSVLWNAMIHPLLNMTFQGVVWYQGEANTAMNTDLYNCTFPALIEDWRETFHEGSVGQTERSFPFGFVQLSTDRLVEIDDSFPRIRWHQTADYGYVPNTKMPNTFMAVALDLCDGSSPYGSIHPRDKQSVAYRLHLGALAVAYGKENVTFQGPYPEQVLVDAALKILNVTYNQNIHLHHMDSKVFEVCCSDPALCEWNTIAIRTASFRTVSLQNIACPETVTGLRYAWTEWPCDYKQCPLYNLQSLPAPPFISFSHNNPSWVVS
ncbi:PREDICTED: sialate O-acetylesterase [Gekko japonicus]|uniref:Sialate O-acetylesterase n=1 Tax=Gekko japonicus TaxID=146911 RepID=A0ABM1LG02_GEKJA|nr:PREDICTED: sialate O-acetylesterase [Gekko japonicus]